MGSGWRCVYNKAFLDGRDLLIFYFLEYEDEDSGEVRFIRLLVERDLDDE